MTHQQPRPIVRPPVLRQAPERPPFETVTTDEPSWWVSAVREGFTAAAMQQLARMQTSKEYRLNYGVTVGMSTRA